MVRQNDRDVLDNLPYTLVCSLTYMRLQRHSVIKVIPWFCTAHLLLRITRWPP